LRRDLNPTRDESDFNVLPKENAIMNKMKLNNKLMVMALSMVIFVMGISTIAVSIVITVQNRHASNDLLKKSFTIITDDISELTQKLAADSRQMATIDDMSNNIKYITESNKEFEDLIVRDVYSRVVKNIYNLGRMGKVWKMAFYDLAGDLIAFTIIEDEGTVLGYAHRFPQLAFTLASLRPGETLQADSWEKADQPPAVIAPTFDKDIPQHETIGFEQVDNFLCLVSYVPIMGPVYNEKTEQLETRQIACLTAAKRLDQAVVSRMSRLTGMNINIFLKDGLSIGDIDAYTTVQTGPIEQARENWSLERQKVVLNDIALQNDAYYQGVLPLYGDSGYVGAIAALYSKDGLRTNTLLILVSLACIGMIVPITFLFSNLLTKPINRIIKALNSGAEQVASASAQVSSSSQSLAEGASEQASSLEETSSSLEEMASMTRQNADNAQQADRLSKESLENLRHANASMKSLIQSMQETSTASGNVAKIIKTIDEIAFQTNLLALNAAVEAARAGEAGAGFAVVADEVRNLAQRSAEASGNTQELIEDIIQKIGSESNLVQETHNLYGAAAESAQKVTELVEEISAANNQQASGIEQVSKTVVEMDKVTQQTAANAEESASASDQMTAQAEQMKALVGELVALVGGSKARAEDRRHGEGRGEQRGGPKPPALLHKSVAAPAKGTGVAHLKPHDVIPMDEGKLMDF
jgi:methyl-accepting chemotaxis protein